MSCFKPPLVLLAAVVGPVTTVSIPAFTGVFYNELETRVRLSKRRKLNQSGQFAAGGAVGGSGAPKTRLIVHHRDFTDDELKAQTDRLYMLEHELEEEEEEEDGDDAEEGTVAGDEEPRSEGDEEEDVASETGSAERSVHSKKSK